MPLVRSSSDIERVGRMKMTMEIGSHEKDAGWVFIALKKILEQRQRLPGDGWWSELAPGLTGVPALTNLSDQSTLPVHVTGT